MLLKPSKFKECNLKPTPMVPIVTGEVVNDELLIIFVIKLVTRSVLSLESAQRRAMKSDRTLESVDFFSVMSSMTCLFPSCSTSDSLSEN